jgi:hypothetical protein
MTSPKTQQALTQIENPKFQAYDNTGVIRGHSYFPGNDNATFNNEHISLEQARYLQRMNQAALKQNASYIKNVSRQSDLTEKEKYAQRIED